jgi:hypothetical protein
MEAGGEQRSHNRLPACHGFLRCGFPASDQASHPKRARDNSGRGNLGMDYQIAVANSLHVLPRKGLLGKSAAGLEA